MPRARAQAEAAPSWNVRPVADGSRSRPEIGSFRSQTIVTNQDDQVVMTFVSIVLIRRRPEGG